MLGYKQLHQHDPANGVYGDCWRTAIGCLLSLPPHQLPHVHRPFDDWREHPVEKWLDERGFRLLTVIYEGQPLDVILATVSSANPGVEFMISGTSRSNCNHVCIARDGRIIHDPSIHNTGLIGPCLDGYWWVNFLVGKLPTFI